MMTPWILVQSSSAVSDGRKSSAATTCRRSQRSRDGRAAPPRFWSSRPPTSAISPFRCRRYSSASPSKTASSSLRTVRTAHSAFTRSDRMTSCTRSTRSGSPSMRRCASNRYARSCPSARRVDSRISRSCSAARSRASVKRRISRPISRLLTSTRNTGTARRSKTIVGATQIPGAAGSPRRTVSPGRCRPESLRGTGTIIAAHPPGRRRSPTREGLRFHPGPAW